MHQHNFSIRENHNFNNMKIKGGKELVRNNLTPVTYLKKTLNFLKLII